MVYIYLVFITDYLDSIHSDQVGIVFLSSFFLIWIEKVLFLWIPSPLGICGLWGSRLLFLSITSCLGLDKSSTQKSFIFFSVFMKSSFMTVAICKWEGRYRSAAIEMIHIFFLTDMSCVWSEKINVVKSGNPIERVGV